MSEESSENRQAGAGQLYTRKNAAIELSQKRQAGVITATADQFRTAMRNELIEHFRWTSLEGLVELEADSIARSAFARLRDDLAMFTLTKQYETQT